MYMQCTVDQVALLRIYPVITEGPASEKGNDIIWHITKIPNLYCISIYPSITSVSFAVTLNLLFFKSFRLEVHFYDTYLQLGYNYKFFHKDYLTDSKCYTDICTCCHETLACTLAHLQSYSLERKIYAESFPSLCNPSPSTNSTPNCSHKMKVLITVFLHFSEIVF